MQELAVMVARSRNGETKAFPVVETIHKDSICHTTEAPAQIPAAVQLQAQRVAQQAVGFLEGISVSKFDVKISDLFKAVSAPRATMAPTHYKAAHQSHQSVGEMGTAQNWQ